MQTTIAQFCVQIYVKIVFNNVIRYIIKNMFITIAKQKRTNMLNRLNISKQENFCDLTYEMLKKILKHPFKIVQIVNLNKNFVYFLFYFNNDR